MKLGFCHCCGIFVTELTDEHAPPLQTQKLIPARMLLRNSMTKMKEHNMSKRRLPPAIRAPGGFKFKTFCKVCQGKTQKAYGAAFREWVEHGLRLAQSVVDYDSTVVRSSISIQPLNVIKQMASNALAVSLYSETKHKRQLRAFVQAPSRKELPPHVRFLLYLNAVRPDYELPQCRYEHDEMIVDTLRGIRTDLLAEIAVPPFGVVTLIDNGHRLPPHLRALMDISYFAEFDLDQRADVELMVPVRTVFGYAPLRFWQDAIKEDAFK